MTTTTMRAIGRQRYGAPKVLELEQVEIPVLADDRVLVRVRACSVNPVDWYDVTGTPWIARPMTGWRRPKTRPVGRDFAGTVEAVGKAVVELQPGDDVYGLSVGAFADYVSAGVGVGLRPVNLTVEEAAAVPIAGLTALQGLRDHADVQPGQHVLVNGASGGVGTFAVQIAKALGARVTAVCSTGNVDQALSLGADHVIDYRHEDFTRGGTRYDAILDCAGTRSWWAYKRVMCPQARLVTVGAPKRNRLLGPLGHVVRMKLAALPSTQTAAFFVAKPNREDLDVLRELIESGQVKPVVERCYPLSELADALEYLGEGHAKGKIVVSI